MAALKPRKPWPPKTWWGQKHGDCEGWTTPHDGEPPGVVTAFGWVRSSAMRPGTARLSGGLHGALEQVTLRLDDATTLEAIEVEGKGEAFALVLPGAPRGLRLIIPADMLRELLASKRAARAESTDNGFDVKSETRRGAGKGTTHTETTATRKNAR